MKSVGDLKSNNQNLSRLLIWTILINVMLPKAGFKWNGIPITIGMVLALCLIVQFTFTKRKIKGVFLKEMMIPIFFWMLRLSIGIKGGIEYFSVLVVFPLIYFPVSYMINSYERMKKVINIIDVGVTAIMLYSLLQFIVGIGKCAIPGITVNFSDWVAAPNRWWLEKMNDIGSGSKIISTYQNGNLYSCSLLLLFPITYHIKRRRTWIKYARLILFVVCIFLAGSRSAYIGLAFYFIYGIISVIKKHKVKKKVFNYIGLVICTGMLSLSFIWKYASATVSRLTGSFDVTTLLAGAGRTENALTYFKWLTAKGEILNWIFGSFGFSYDGGAYEMTYIAVFVMGGIVGLCLFLGPIIKILCARDKCYENKSEMNEIAYGLKTGCIVYLVAANIEGAFWLPPTAINFWTMMALYSSRALRYASRY